MGAPPVVRPDKAVAGRVGDADTCKEPVGDAESCISEKWCSHWIVGCGSVVTRSEFYLGFDACHTKRYIGFASHK
ncbi:hypothetical protein SDC9_121872 [bioreactor metagenome]|uniref:Uncharacterized protein n=1 Tax=bioreactor metagenome TaxID=1076179 RepID=A0A645CD99_9ZZZZ